MDDGQLPKRWWRVSNKTTGKLLYMVSAASEDDAVAKGNASYWRNTHASHNLDPGCDFVTVEPLDGGDQGHTA